MKRAARRDDNEQAIVVALEQVGAVVYRMDEEGVPDLLVGWCARTFLLEVKSATGTLTEAQEGFFLRWKGVAPVIVRTPMEALRAIGAI